MKLNSGAIGIDVSDLKEHRILPDNIEFVIIRTSIAGDWLDSGMYGSDSARYQIQDANTKNIPIMAYHGSNFGDDSNTALQEAQYAVRKANKYGITPGHYLALDWETKAGSDIYKNTKAIMSFLDYVSNAGYKPLLYIGEYYLEHIDVSTIYTQYGCIFWLASYLHHKTLDEKVKELSSKNEVLICQFTDNFNTFDGDVVIHSFSSMDIGD